MFEWCSDVRGVVEESQPKKSPARRFAASLNADQGLVYGGLLREMPVERNLSASEFVKELGGYWRLHETGWYLYLPGKSGRKPTVWFYPIPGRFYPRVLLAQISLDYASSVTSEFRAMLNFFSYHESEWEDCGCFILLG